ncbi:tRNA (adenosine(37)-N6)-threonylcarbamoyltransferase complex dimerization subunit type 1 TsaB [Azoarcus olearius]|uniref:Conserved hypothetical glycoprotease n=1 Tax=Azoarcus sp. (strain BH72) TaxID=418699 RepID=A1K673_AZOSB|nr:tRNA (adenosine(37)-N6)-threonylcarbamoyltransferase complex dimerization subunit type 1 TsaB [Azoarcus olearius]CAL94328.1 conserved hypothetical glycoprotease [Azoarcus olearius]
MKVLAIETSSERASIALLSSGERLTRELLGHANHSEHILSALTALLAEGGCGLGQLDCVAFGSGPGAFTGVRLACGIAQGLALGADLGLVGVCSLAALANQAPGTRIVAATDARMGEIYHAAYEREGDALRELTAPACSLPQELALGEGDWNGIGSAFAAYGDALAERWPGRWLGIAPDAVPRAEDVAVLAAQACRAGRLLAPEDAVPLYVRDKVALTTAERLARGGRA